VIGVWAAVLAMAVFERFGELDEADEKSKASADDQTHLSKMDSLV